MIINSRLDTDLYKLTTLYIFWKYFRGQKARYVFKCRNKGINLAPLVNDINRELDHLCTLKFHRDEYLWLWELGYWPDMEFRRWLLDNKLQRRTIKAEVRNNDLYIEADGPLEDAMQFEIYVMEIVNELYFQKYYPGLSARGLKLLRQGLAKLPEDFTFAEFGCRRRYSFDHQDAVLAELKDCGAARFNFAGTSNLYFAKKYGLREIGTQPHEFFQVCQANFPLRYFQKEALKLWIKTFPTLDTALTDTIGIHAFCRDLDRELAIAYKGYRHDSGPPDRWREVLLNRLDALKVETLETKATYSNSLNFESATHIHHENKGICRPGFGLGTFVTNNVGQDVTPLNIVMKIVMCDGQHVAKLSDDEGKGMSESPTYEAYLREVIHFQQLT